MSTNGKKNGNYHQLPISIPEKLFVVIAGHITKNKLRKKGHRSYQDFIVRAIQEKVERDGIQ